MKYERQGFMYYREAAEKIEKILNDEKINLRKKFINNFLIVMSEMCNYSEEDHKIRPQIIVGENLNTYFETITPRNYFVMYEDYLDGDQFLRYFKSLALFCDNGWYIVINVNDDKLEYGIFRRYTNIDGKRFEDFFKDSFVSIPNSHMIIIKAMSNFEISITRFDQEDEIISQKFIESDSSEYDKIFNDIANDIVPYSEYEGKDVKFVRRCILKVLRNFPMKIHGTIMLIVEDDFKLPENNLSGIKLLPPIDFYDIFLNYQTIESYSDAENVYSLTGLFYEMLNTDGITIITNKGRLLYYNVFYQGEIPKDVKGGARKRTALGIYQNDELLGICSVYFQSQDGEVMYKRKGLTI